MTRKVLFAAFCALALVGCKKTADVPDKPGEVVVTGEAVDVTSSSATLVAYYNTTRYMRFDDKWMYYSTSRDAVKTSKFINSPTEESSKGAYFKVTGLQPATTYYYCAYVDYYYITTSNRRVYGEIRSFTTLAE